MQLFSKKVAVVCAVMVSMLMAVALISCENDTTPGCGETNPTLNTLATTQNGTVRGVQEGDMVAFRGIPYAAPPVGDLRWKAPQDPADWSGERDASEFGNTCPQVETPFGAGSLNEDCLFLNVATPDTSGSLPVMVWIHGGAFVSGSGQEADYNPARLVQEGVVVVTLNYRLGALGFLPHPALTDESGQSGNYGIMDQQKALKWVQNNIAAFGGNPKNVTIFGESAGGHSVYTHMVTPSSKGLFHKAIAESGAYFPTQPTMEAGYALYAVPFAKRAAEIKEKANVKDFDIGIDNPDYAKVLADMRTNMSVSEVLAAQGSDWYVPMTGGILPKSIFDATTAGEFNKVPLISGSNLDEGRLFTALDMAQGINYDTRQEVVDKLTPLLAQAGIADKVDQVVDKYVGMQKATDPNRFRLAYSQIWTDFMFATPNFDLWTKLARSTDVYAYWFKDVNAPSPLSFLFSDALPKGAAHTDEIQYVFGVVGRNGGTAKQIALSEEMVGYWTTFAKQGKPASSGWSAFRDGKYAVGGDLGILAAQLLSTVKALDTPSKNDTASAYMNTHNCMFWGELLQ